MSEIHKFLLLPFVRGGSSRIASSSLLLSKLPLYAAPIKKVYLGTKRFAEALRIDLWAQNKMYRWDRRELIHLVVIRKTRDEQPEEEKEQEATVRLKLRLSISNDGGWCIQGGRRLLNLCGSS